MPEHDTIVAINIRVLQLVDLCIQELNDEDIHMNL